MSVINTNITSMIGQQNLQSSQSNLTTSMERLSSGLRINSAKDDAAGQAIANRFQAQTTGLSQAQRNANDGISVAQTAEGALNKINDNVQRVRELTVQAANDTNSQEDLNSIQDEIGQRLNEIDRISEQTDFNGTKVLDEGVNGLDIQVGANDGETITINLEAINAEKLGIDDFNVNGLTGTPSAAGLSAGNAGTTLKIGDLKFDVVAASGATKGEMEILASTSISATYGSSFPEGMSSALTSAKILAADNGDLYAEGSVGGETVYYAVDAEATAASGSAGYAKVEFSIKGGEDARAIPAEATTSPLKTLDSALSKIDNLRSDLGAIQNRFESAITNLSTNETNLTAAQSRIEDADYAKEVANMTKNQILQQAGTSVLAQANQLPQNVLSLLG